MYQTTKVDALKAIQLTQNVADKISFDLGLDEPFSALQFLRDGLMVMKLKLMKKLTMAYQMRKTTNHLKPNAGA